MILVPSKMEEEHLILSFPAECSYKTWTAQLEQLLENL